MEYLKYSPYIVVSLVFSYIIARLVTRAYFNSRKDYEKEEGENE